MYDHEGKRKPYGSISHIYVLRHPTTREIRYVGKTRDTTLRYVSHVSEPHPSNKALQQWIDGLKREGLILVMEIIEICEKSQEIVREAWWIDHHKNGGRLLNKHIPLVLPQPPSAPATASMTVVHCHDEQEDQSLGMCDREQLDTIRLYVQSFARRLKRIPTLEELHAKWRTDTMLMRFLGAPEGFPLARIISYVSNTFDPSKFHAQV